MYSVWGPRLAPNFGVRPAAEDMFYLRLTVEEMRAFVVFSEKYLRTYGCSDTNFATAVICTYTKTEIQREI